MSRNRRKLTGRKESGRFIRLPFSVIDTKAFISLSANAQKLWIDLLRQYQGSNNGKIAAIHSQLRIYRWANSSLHKALIELQEKGFLIKTRQGGLGPIGKLPTFYRFTHLPKGEFPDIGLANIGPSNEFRHLEPPRKSTSSSGGVNHSTSRTYVV